MTARCVQFQTGKGKNMETCKTLNELHTELGVTRRAVQGYEKAGLVSASGKNKYGHLLYDEKAQERIARIKLFQQLGFTIKEIKSLMDAPHEVVKASLEIQIRVLKEQRADLDLLIEKAYELMKELNGGKR